jgi:hypothetical protein
MRELLAQDQKFVKEEISKIKAKKLFAGQPYKLELIKELPGKTVSIYTSGSFVDLCKGPHVKSTKEIDIKAFKLTKIAGAYWRANEKNKMLTRIYGVAFATEQELKDYLKMMEEAEKRDHRILGAKLKLFTISELIGAGLPLMQPKGMIIRKEIEDYLWDLHKSKGYDRVWTPHIAKKDLYETSGHAAKFGNELFKVKGGTEEFYIKPMNCPHHMQIFADNQFSYRDMPVRYFEPATVYRYEKTGEYFNVYYSPEVPKFKADEKILKDFKNLGNNKYQAYNKTSIAGVYDYGFDEGSIWTLKTYEDGQQYLVKEINGDDENDVVRTKKASSNEQKDTVSNTINNSGKYKVLLEKLDKKIIATLKEGKCVVTDNLVSEIREKLIMNGFNNASKNIVLSIAKSETTEKGGNR